MKDIKQMDEWLIRLSMHQPPTSKEQKRQFDQLLQSSGCPYLKEKYQQNTH